MSNGPDFRYHYSNSLTFSVTNHDMRIVFAVAEDPAKPEDSINQTGVYLTHKTAKLLHFILSESIRRVEEGMGAEIPLDEAKKAKLRGVIGGEDTPTEEPTA